MKRALPTAIALLLAVCLFLTWRFWEGPEREAEVSPYTVSRDEIASFEVTEGEKKILLKTDEKGEWKAEGMTEKVDPGKILSFLEFWSSPRAEPVAVKGPQWDAYGLESPSKELSLTSKDGQQTKISLGKKSPVGWKVYLRVGENLYLIPETVASQVSADPKNFTAPLAVRPEPPTAASPGPSSPEEDAH